MQEIRENVMSGVVVEGSLAMVKPAWHHLSSGSDHVAGELYQTSLMSALMAGIYEGEVTYGELRKHGDFGLGTFNGLDGEMIGFDGTFYQLRSDGSAHPVAPEQKTPFAVVTFFEPDQELELEEGMDKKGLLALIDGATDANLFTAIKIDGTFDEVRTRTVQQQKKPYPPLTDATKHQAEKTFANVLGTLAGFRTPAYAQGIGVAGLHLHFLREDKQEGGHALDYRLRGGRVQLNTLHGFHVELPTSGAFLKASFNDGALNEKIKASEG
jgi:acetolactate decarboxylase